MRAAPSALLPMKPLNPYPFVKGLVLMGLEQVGSGDAGEQFSESLSFPSPRSWFPGCSSSSSG